MTDTQTLTPAAAPPGAHPLANARQRAADSTNRLLDMEFRSFMRAAADSDKQFLLRVFIDWQNFPGEDLGICSAFETAIRNSHVRITPLNLQMQPEGEEIEAQPDTPADDVGALIEQAMQSTGVEESISETFRGDTVDRLRKYLEELLTEGTDGEKHFLLEVLITRESCTRGRHEKQIPLAEAFEHELRGIEKEMVRLPRDYYEDWKAYEQWRSQEPDASDEGIFGPLIEIISTGHWTGRLLERMARTWKEKGSAGLSPDTMRILLDFFLEEFEDNIEFAQELLAQYPELVKAGAK